MADLSSLISHWCQNTRDEATCYASIFGYGSKPPSSDNSNPITKWFEIKEMITTAGPGLIWSVYNATSKTDTRSNCSVFWFDTRDGDKLFKPKRKEAAFQKMREGINELLNGNIAQTLKVVHPLEEGPNTMAFATEPILTTFHHVFAWYETMNDDEPITVYPPSKDQITAFKIRQQKKPTLPPFAAEHFFENTELAFGFLQIREALGSLHYDKKMVHTNVCPQNIVITSTGVWKLIGLEFLQPITTDDYSAMMPLLNPNEMEDTPIPLVVGKNGKLLSFDDPNYKKMTHDPCNMKLKCANRSNLDYSAPEVQLHGHISALSDIFSFGMIIAGIYNNGKSLFNAKGNITLYVKQLKKLTQRAKELLPRMPDNLQQAVDRMLQPNPQIRPSIALLPRTAYFSMAINDSVVKALQGFNMLSKMNQSEKNAFLKSVTQPTMDRLPKTLKYQLVFESMKPELQDEDGIGHGLSIIVYMIQDEPQIFFSDLLHPVIWTLNKTGFVERSPLAVYAFLKEFKFIYAKSKEEEDIRLKNIHILNTALKSTNRTVLTTAVETIMNCMEWLNDDSSLEQTLSGIKDMLERYSNDITMSTMVLNLFEKLMVKLNKNHLVVHVVPSLLIMKLDEPSVMERVVSIYNMIVTDERLGLPHELMATKMLPSLAPYAVNKRMDHAQFAGLIEIMDHMVQFIKHEQHIAIDQYMNMPLTPLSIPASRPINLDEPVEFYIPKLRKKTLISAEELAPSNTYMPPPTETTSGVGSNIKCMGDWLFGSKKSTNSNNMNNGAGPSGIAAAASGNLLRVAKLLPGRRLSDNTMMAPKITITPSSASSPGVTPGGSQADEPARQHSSIGPQEQCRGSRVNLSPPTVHYGRRNGARSGSTLSVPMQHHSAGGSLRSSKTSMNPRNGSAQSVRSVPSDITARAAFLVGKAATCIRRPPSASSGKQPQRQSIHKR